MATPIHLTCLDCEHQQPFESYAPTTCQRCGSKWLQPQYDLQAFKREVLSGFPFRPRNLWRYHDLLPVKDADRIAALLPAGGTPLAKAQGLATHLGLRSLYIKDERQGPTSSFKDRQAAVAVGAMVEAGTREAVIASTGNAAVAYAAACARAGIKLWVFMTSMVPQEKQRETALFGAEVIKVSGNYDQTKQIAADFAQRRRLFLDRGATHIPSREAFKTIAYEIVEQLGWRAPDWYLQAVSGGMGPLGVYYGFKELYDMGLTDRIPKIGILQAEGCAPMVQAFKARRDVAEPVIPETHIAILSTGDPGETYTRLYNVLQTHGGTMEAVSDREAFDAMTGLAQREGMAMEPAAAVAFAGLEKLARQGTIRPDELVVVNGTGHTFPVEKHVLGDQWVVDIHLSEDQANAPHEGLEAALNNLDERATTVLLLDDNPDDALLVQRLLEVRKKYRIFHATNGWEGLTIARQRLPDLIVTDLMMPEIDGFGVIEELKLDPRTRNIPIVVVSAKDIQPNERQRLEGAITAIYQKGSLSPRAFVDKVVGLLDEDGVAGDN